MHYNHIYRNDSRDFGDIFVLYKLLNETEKAWFFGHAF